MKYIEQFTRPNQDRIEVLYAMLCGSWLQNHEHDEVKMRVIYRNIANAIHDCGDFWTGYVSKAAIDRIVITNKPPQVVCVKDHFFGRNNSGVAIANMFFGNTPTFEMFAQAMYTHCQVHRVLKEENNRAKPFQNNKGVSWKGAYKNAKIELVYIPMGDKKKLTRKILREYQYEPTTSLSTIKV